MLWRGGRALSTAANPEPDSPKLVSVSQMFAAGIILLVLTNGPVFLVAKDLLDGRGHWEAHGVWPFFAGAALLSALIAVRVAQRHTWGSRLEQGTLAGQPRVGTRASRLVPFSGSVDEPAQRLAVAAIVWFSGVSVLSAIWSVDSSETLWRAAVYVGLASLAWVIAVMPHRELCSVVALVSATAVAGSILMVVLRPDLGIDTDGNWKGLYTNRNSLAPLAAIGLICSIRLVWVPRRATRVLGVLLALLSVTTMFAAASRTAVIAVVVAFAVSAEVFWLRWYRRRVDPAAARVVTAAAALATLGVAIASVTATWNIATFTQRRAIWSLVWERIQQRPIAGHGFFTFWDIDHLTQHVLLRRGSAHNSLVEVGLGLGVIGAVPFVVIVGLALRQSLLGFWRAPGRDTWMWFCVVAFLVVENLTESFVLWFSYNWVLLAAAAMRSTKPVPPSPSTLSTVS